MEVEEYLLIAMPRCDRSLCDRLRECRQQGILGIPRDELLGYMFEAARGLDYLNESCHPMPDGRLMGVQHRDVKPQNLFLVGGSVRVADFGLARVLEGSLLSSTTGGTVAYMSPEQIDERVSRYSDQYALAATYCHLRTGQLPFQGSHAAIMMGHLGKSPDLSALPRFRAPSNTSWRAPWPRIPSDVGPVVWRLSKSYTGPRYPGKRWIHWM